MTEAQIATSFLTFAQETLGLDLYRWQARVLEPFDHASNRLVQVTLVSPNGAGKSSVCIPALILGWLTVYEKGRVALTTNDSKQLDNQVMPALNNYRHLFPTWKFIERRIETPTGGFFYGFTTTGGDRVEGAHKLNDTDGPLLAIVDEAKSVDQDIFLGIDRWTYNAILLTSSPGPMYGRFYESHTQTPGFVRVQAGLKDCPHIGEDKIRRLQEQYGPNGTTPNAAYLASTLEGQFMTAEGEIRFNREGLDYLAAVAATDHDKATRGVLKPQPWMVNGMPAQTWSDDSNGWVWLWEAPKPGCRYIGFCDPTTGAQSEGSNNRDTHGCGIMRAAYTDSRGIGHDAEVVAVFYVPSTEEHSGAACRWDNDILAARFAMVLRHFGNCMAVVEANNSGTEVIRLLLLEGCNLWHREKPNHRNPHKRLEVVGFQTTAQTKNYWIGALGAGIRDGTFNCRFLPAVKQFGTFILNDKGTGEAQSGMHDDFCTGIALALLQINAASEMPGFPVIPVNQFGGCMIVATPLGQGQETHGACS